MKVRCSAASDVGLKREINQDSYGIGDQSLSEQKGLLLIVCDGMGGHAAGEIASKLGVQVILEHYYTSDDSDRVSLLEHAFYHANRRIYDDGEGTMGTTGVAALIYKGNLYIANVGDSRAYLIREGHIDQISRDHSLVAEQLTAGLITAEQARQSSYRNMITRALGYRPEVQVDIFKLAVQNNDIIVLSSDGLHGLVDDDEISQVATTMPPEEAVKKLIIMANDRGGVDNITATVAIIDDVGTPDDTEEQEDNQSHAITRPRIIGSLGKDTEPDTDDTMQQATRKLSHITSYAQDSDSKSVPRAPSAWPMIAGSTLALIVLAVLGVIALRNSENNQVAGPITSSANEPAQVQNSTVTIQRTSSPSRILSPTLPIRATVTHTPTKTRIVSPTNPVIRRTTFTP